jgi:hypothetical protein
MIPRDKLLHLALGVLAIACALAALTIHAWWGLGACLAYTTTAVGVLYEVQQWYRREGQPDIYDALATAAPGWVAWALLEILL